MDCKQTQPHNFILLYSLYSVICSSSDFCLSLIVTFSLYQYFEGDDLPEATAREIDLLMDQPDQFRGGACVCVCVINICLCVW